MKDDVIETALQRFTACVDHESDNREQWLDDLEFSEGDQWPEKVKEDRERDNRPCLTLNRIPAFIRQIVNDIRQIRPAIKVRPVDSEADPETAEVLNGMIRAIEQDSSAESAYDWAAEYAVRMGVGYWRISTEYETETTMDQVIRIERIRNPFSVYIDATAERQDASDMTYAFVIQRMTRDEFDEKYPNAESTWSPGIDDSYDDWWFGEDHVRVAEYWEVKEEKFTLYQVADPVTGEAMMTDEKPPEGVEIIADRESTKRTVIQRIITGNEVLEENEWPGKYIPIVRCLGREIDVQGRPYIYGLVRDLQDPQRQYNYFRSASTERIALYSKAPYVGPKGAFKNPKWRQANTKNYAYLEYDGDVPPRREPPPDISPGFANEVSVAAEELKAIASIYDPGLGARSNEVSGVAIDSRKLESDVSNFDFVDNLARAMTYAGKILVDLIPKIYTGARVVRILKPAGEDEAVQVNAPFFDQQKQKQRMFNLEAGRYDVAVDIGPSYTTQRKAASESMMELIKAMPTMAPVLGDLLTSAMDWPNADEVAKRMKLLLPPEILQNENPAIAQLMQQKDMQMQQAQQQMQQLQQLMAQMQQQFQQQYNEMQLQLKNKEGELAAKNRELDIKQADLARNAQKDEDAFTVDMTDLEIKANKDLGQAGVAYP